MGLGQWNLPDGVIDTMRDHHDSGACQGKYRRDCLVRRSGELPVLGDGELLQLDCTLWSSRAMRSPPSAWERSDILVLAEDLDRELSMNGALFQL